MLAVETTTFPETEPFVVLLNSLTTCDEAFLTDEEEPVMELFAKRSPISV